jgi:hypothetical protein
MKKINNELEKIIYDEQRFNDAVTTICNDIESQSRKAIETLRKHFGDEITNDIDSLHTFNDEARFREFIKSARASYINAVKFMPSEEKSRIYAMYDDLYDGCVDSVKCLQRLFKLPYSLHYDGTSLSIDEKEVAKKIRQNFEIKLSDEEREYYSLVAGVVNSLNAMHDFETKHGYIEFSFNGINRLNRLGFFRKVLPMVFYKDFSEEKFLAALRGGTIGKDKDI